MRKLQVQGVHHITLTGADRQTSIDFWEGVIEARAGPLKRGLLEGGKEGEEDDERCEGGEGDDVWGDDVENEDLVDMASYEF